MSWKQVKLENLITQPVKNGYSPVCPDIPNGRWVLGLGALNGHGLDVTQIKPAPANDKKVEEFVLKPGDFLISRSNTIDKVGRSALFKGQIEKCSYPDLMMRFRVDNSKILPEFLEFYLRSPKAVSHFQRSASGTSVSMVKINKKAVESLSVPMPPLYEQAAIADLLSTWDTAIDKIERLIAAKKKLLSAFRQELFKIREEKNGWRKVRLSSVLKEHCNLSDGGQTVFSVSVHKGLVNQVEHLGRSFSASDLSKYNRVHFGDIVYTKSPTGEFPYGIVKQSLIIKDVVVSPLYGVFMPQTVELGTILDFYFESPTNARNYLHPIIQKGAKNTINITNKTFLSGKLILPISEKEQKKISGFLISARREIYLLKKQLEAYRRQKRGLMQKLLTDEWRVRVGS